MGYKIGMVSLGCAKNLTDSETMLGLLKAGGYEIVGNPAEADVIVVNTCGFIESAKQESVDTILEMAEYKKTSGCRALIVTGCLAERYKKEIIAEIPEVDGVLGTGDYYKIITAVENVLKGEITELYGHFNDEIPENLPRLTATGTYTAYLKIAEGCDNHCTYCIIPKLRGVYRSRPTEEILREAAELAAAGVKEIVVIAQDTTRYGIDLYGEYSLDRLLRKLAELDGIEWIRVHYCYPEAITDGLISVFADTPKICKYMDIPIQHISDEVLKRMGRASTGESIKKLIEGLRSKIKGISLRTSLIVGFPGETEEQFKELEEFVKWARFDRLGVFQYSQEEDTPAAMLSGQIDESVKLVRYEKIMKLQHDIAEEQAKACIGKTYKVLTEGYDYDRFMYFGRSYRDSLDVDGTVYFASEDEVKEGAFCNVKILDVEEYDLIGVKVNEHCE